MAQGTWRVDPKENAELQKTHAEEQKAKYDDVIAFKPQAGVVSSGNTKALRYPKDRQISDNTDYVSFRFFHYKPPFGSGREENAKNIKGKNLAEDLNNKQRKKAGEDTAKQNVGALYGQSNTNIDHKNLVPAEGKGYKDILLYMPEDINAQYGANWGAAGWGVGAALLAKGIGSFGYSQKSTVEKWAEGFGAAGDAFMGGTKIGGFKAMTEGMNKALGTSITPNQLQGGITGTITNPNVEMMYEAPEMRGFTLNFKMVARSNDESREIRNICGIFKKAMLPEYGGQTMAGMATSGALLTIPKVCQPTFMTGSKSNPYVSQFKPCVITAVNVNYTPDGAWATYQEGDPVATQLTLTFKEMKLVFAQEINPTGVSF